MSLPYIGIQTSQDARFYTISSAFDKFSNADSTLVIQFTVKHEQKIDCGGGYVKVRGGREKKGKKEGVKRERFRIRERGVGTCVCRLTEALF